MAFKNKTPSNLLSFCGFTAIILGGIGFVIMLVCLVVVIGSALFGGLGISLVSSLIGLAQTILPIVQIWTLGGVCLFLAQKLQDNAPK